GTRICGRGHYPGNNQFLPVRAFCFDPIVPATGAIRRVCDLRDNALQTQLTGVSKQRTATLAQRFAETQEVRLAIDESSQCIFPTCKRQVSQVSAVEMQKIKRIEFHTVVTVILEILLQLRKT